MGPDDETVFARLRGMLPDVAAVLRINEAFLVDKGVEELRARAAHESARL